MDTHYSRTRIDKLLASGIEYPYVCVIAGPGYHKTQCVKGFVRNSDYNVVWLHLSSKDNYTEVFWENFVDSMSTTLPHLREKLNNTSFPDSISQTYSLIKILNEQVSTENKILLVIDDYASIDNEAVKSFVKNLLGTPLENRCVIIINDEKIDLDQAGIPHHGEVFHINGDDLKFNGDEIRQYFKYYNAELTDDEVDYVLEKTDGWPLSLNSLLSHYNNGKLNKNTSVHNVSLVMNLFESNYFSKYSKEVQKVFVSLSLLPRFTIDIIKKIAGAHTENAVDEVFNNIFITFDYNTNSFVFQKMYKEFLQLKRYLLEESDIKNGFEFAGDYFFEEKNNIDALECYMAAENYEKFVIAVNHKSTKKYSKKYIDYVLDSLELFPNDFKKDNLDVCLMRAFFFLAKMEVKKSESLFISLADKLNKKNRTPSETRMLGEVYVALGDIEIVKNTDQFVDYYIMAQKYLNGPSDIMTKNSYRVRNNQVFFLPSNQAGALEKIVKKYFDATPYIESLSTGLGYGVEYLFAGEAEMMRCNVSKAKDYFYKAIYKAEKYNQDDIIMNAYLNIMRIELYLGNARQIKEHYIKASKIESQQNVSELTKIKGFIDTWLYSHLDDVEKMPQWVRKPEEEIDDYIPIDAGRNLVAHSVYLTGIYDHANTIHELRKLDVVFKERGMWQLKISVHILECISLMHLKKIDEAVSVFKKAYDMAYSNDTKFLFIEYGNLMRTMVDFVEKSDLNFDHLWLKNLSNKCIQYANNKTTVVQSYKKLEADKKRIGVKLTKRELEVLEHLANGLNREEISNELNISVNGVKKHITNIYSKLGAVNRADAIRIATTNGYDL